MTVPALVIGVGNRDRGDDAVGPAVADAVGQRFGTTTEHMISEGDLSGLAIAWHPDQAVVIVDAMVSGRPPGTILEVDGLESDQLETDGLEAHGRLSSHGFGVAEAIRLARLLDRLPHSLTVIAVEAETFELFAPLSADVANAVPEVLTRISNLLRL